MIEPTDSDIGRRVLFDPKVKGIAKARGTLVGIHGGWNQCWTQVQFDDDEHHAPLNVGNGHLYWEDRRNAR